MLRIVLLLFTLSGLIFHSPERTSDFNHFEVAQCPLDTNPSTLEYSVSEYISDIPVSDAFLLESNPNALRTIYLDFDGEIVSGTGWNWWYNGGKVIEAVAWDIDDNPDSFSDEERRIIIDVWSRVVEDFAIFEVNVTTKLPMSDALIRLDYSDETYGSHVVFTSQDNAIADSCYCGGIAYVGVFDEIDGDYHMPAWVWPNSSDDPKILAEIASHEVGHNLGLRHHGELPNTEYSQGGEGWAPIMGNSYYEPITTWSNGDYINANRIQDDVKKMMSYGLSTKPDDFPGTLESQHDLFLNQETAGVINSRDDTDLFRIEMASSKLVVQVDNATMGPNLDLELTILDKDFKTITHVNPLMRRVSNDLAEGLDAHVETFLPTGTYYIRVDGVSTDSYSDYGIVGTYTITASYKIFNIDEIKIFGSAQINSTLTVRPISLNPNPTNVSYQWYRNSIPIQGATSDTYTTTPLDNLQRISVEVTMSNSRGEQQVEVSPGVMIETWPKAPLPKVNVSGKKVFVRWKAPNTEGAQILGYEYRIRREGKSWSGWKSTGTTREFKLGKLPLSTRHEIQVRLLTEIGSVTSRKIRFTTS